MKGNIMANKDIREEKVPCGGFVRYEQLNEDVTTMPIYGGVKPGNACMLCEWDGCCKAANEYRTRRDAKAKNLANSCGIEYPTPDKPEPVNEHPEFCAWLTASYATIDHSGIIPKLEQYCPDNDCRIFLNVYHMGRDCWEAAQTVNPHARKVLTHEYHRNFAEMEKLYHTNYAVGKYLDAIKEATK